MKYQKEYELKVSHDFFSDNSKWSPKLHPSKSTEKACRNLGVLIRALNGRFDWYIGSEHEENLTEKFSTLSPNLYFLNQKDPSFYNYSDLPFVTDQNQLVLYSIGGSNPPEKRIVNLSQRTFNFGKFHDQKISIRSISSLDSLIEIQSVSPENSIVDFSGFGEGVFEILVNDKVQLNILYTEDPIPSECFAAVWLMDYTIENQEINIEAQNCFWKYEIIISEQYKMESDFSLSVHHSQNEFNGPEVVTSSNGQNVYVFQSKDKYLLKDRAEENPKIELKYKSLHSKINKKLEVVLPIPDASSMHSQKAPNEKLQLYASSRIYI